MRRKLAVRNWVSRNRRRVDGLNDLGQEVVSGATLSDRL